MADFDEALKELFEEEDMQQFGSVVREQGAAAIPHELQRMLNRWKDIPLNVGVTGLSGVGKSTFINAVRRLKPSDQGAAAVGVTERTTEPQAFEHPNNPKVLFWDLPGVGTPKFPKESYLDQVMFETYDCFIIICSERFTENDLWLANQIKVKGKRVYFALTKLDRSISDDKDDNPNTYDEEAVIERDDCINQLSVAGFDRTTVFLICKQPHLYDFPKLEETFVMDIPDLKREVALFCIRGSSEAIIKEKTKVLQARCWKVAAASVATAVVPVPGLSFAVDTALILHEIRLYTEVYGLDDKALTELSSESGISKQTLDRELQKFAWRVCTTQSVVSMLTSYGAEIAIEEAARAIPVIGASYGAEIAIEEAARAIPVIGAFLASPISFFVTKGVLEYCIESMESTALAVINIAFSEATEV